MNFGFTKSFGFEAVESMGEKLEVGAEVGES